MREIFARLLKALWVFNIIGIVGYLSLIILVIVTAPFFGNDLYGLGDEVKKLIGIALLTTSILVFLQYVLLGSFNPKILFKRVYC